jgi:uncharacterized membrane-anchored protein
MLVISTLKPEKLILVSYSSMTLGLIVIIAELFDSLNKVPILIKLIEIILGLVLIVFGFLMSGGLNINKEEREFVKDGLRKYRK